MTETGTPASNESLGGRLLIAMPGMTDPRFRRSLVYLCAHTEEGAMGLIVNKHADDLKLRDLFEKLEIPLGEPIAMTPVHFGGPVETGRGFVLHSADYDSGESTLQVDDQVSMTATVDILHAIAENRGPSRSIVALGYAGWSPGQLEAEMRANGWLACEPDDDLLFGGDEQRKWDRALAKIGVDPAMLSSWGGHA